jgi:hypothetical protein
MGELNRRERAAIEAVAERFSATIEKGGGGVGTFILVAGKRVAVDFSTLNRYGAGPPKATKPQLRFDKVATRLIASLKGTFAKIVPEGTTVLVTITAPIRLASKTTAALEGKIKTLLGQTSRNRDEKATIHGNRVQIKILSGQSKRAPKLIGFVHNSDTDPLRLLNMTRELLQAVGAEDKRPVSGQPRDQWLVVISPEGRSTLEAYRYIHSELRLATTSTKILIVFGDDFVGMLSA